MVTEPGSLQHRIPLRNADTMPEQLLFRRLTVAFGLLAITTAALGILTAHFGITLIGSANPDNKTIALSAALIWIFLGSVLAYEAVKPLQRLAGRVVQVILVVIAAGEAIEFIFNVQGGHFFIEPLFVSAGTTILGPSSSFISPITAGLAIPAALALVLVIRSCGPSAKPIRNKDAISILGLAISLISFTLVLSYIYGDPILPETQFIPIAALSALAAFFTGAALIAAAGPDAVPVKYMIGNSTSAGLLRVFIPLIIGIVFIENFVIVGLFSWFTFPDAVLLSATLVVFSFATAFVVTLVSGEMGKALERAEQELVRKNDDLSSMNEELIAIDEELRQNIDNLAQAKTALKAANEFLEQRVGERTAQLEKAVKDAGAERQRLYGVLETLPVYVCLLDADYHLPFTNKYFRETFGKSHGRCCYDFLFNRTEPCEICKTYTVMKTKAPHHWYWTGPNGRDYDIYDFPFTDTDGSFLILEMGIDITDRNKAVEENKRAGAYNRSLIEASLDPLVTINPDGTISDVNAATTVVTGFSRKELIGTDFSRYFTEPDRAKTGYETVFRDGSVTDYALEIQHRDGHTTPVLYNSTIFLDESGNVAGVFAVARDITERRKAETALQMAHDELEERVQERTRELLQKNMELNAINEELTATKEELQQNVDELGKNEESMRQNESELKEALAEKEILLSEIHHRVKNNLTAFISLLSLDGSYDVSPAGEALRNDLQNRARSMALIHETLYRTGKFSNVDMEIYLTTLVGQIAGSYAASAKIRIVVDARGAVLDLARATTAGLIINELVTNSFKYAFPPGFDCLAVRGEPCTIRVLLAREDGTYVLTVADNGRGLPAEFDPLKTKSLGHKLVNFLARHQLRAEIAVRADKGTEFIFRLNNIENYT